MIRINLLAEGKRPAAVRRTAPSTRRPTDVGNWLMGGAIVVALVICAGYWWVLRSEIKSKDEEIAAARKEYETLEPIIREVEQYKAKKAELEYKIDVIQDLKANQRGPVQVLDQLSRALPELLWLTKLEMTSNELKIQGRAFNTNAIASLIENLEAVPEFEEPIPGETKPAAGNLAAEVFDFQLTVPYRLLPLQESTSDDEVGAAEDEGGQQAAAMVGG